MLFDDSTNSKCGQMIICQLEGQTVDEIK